MPAGTTPIPYFNVCQTGNCAQMTFTEVTQYGSYYPNEISSVEAIVEKPTTYSSGAMDITSQIVYTLTGNVTSVGTSALTGAGTAFDTELEVGDRIFIVGSNVYYTVSAITDATNLTVKETMAAFAGASAIRKRETFQVTPGDLGMASFTDGAYYVYIKYTMTDTTEHEFEREYFFDCNVKCCVFNMLAQIPNYYNCNNCNTEFIDSALTVFALYQGMVWHAARCNFIKALEIKDTIDKICEFNRCNC